ncbi:outer membrane protein TolC [Neolewinella xylanilytica]|uniref:Outer membrane protein TolC n=1 Tax=Neolewinella xylanilytica TaxID=1514080 RepID=A0A2S6I319_9BACT|nr:TolC family protein [Neolewinella xylanilytica]PPK85582.1 outer membrane protein TolC [Neolewinella xylanilytica]
MQALLTYVLLFVCLGLSAQQANPPVFSLQDAVNYAYENANSIRNARVDILDAEQNIREQLSTGFPQISAALDYTRYLKVPVLPLPEAFAALNPDPNAPAPEGIAFQRKNNFTGGLNVSGMLFDGSFFVGLRAARASRDYFNLQLEDAQRQVRNQVTQSYFPVLLTSTNLEIVERNISNLEKLLRETEAQYEAGFVEQLDVDRLVLSLNNLRSTRNDLEQQRENALRALKFSLNFPENQPLDVSEDLEALELEVESAALSSDVPYQQRSEVRLLDQTLALQDLNIDLQKAAYLPRLSLVGSAQYQYQGDSFSDGFWAPTALVGLSAAIPIYDFGGRSSRLERARLDKEKVVNQRDDLVRSIDLEVRNARGSFNAARDRLENTRQNQELAQRIYETTQIKYREGVGSSIEVVQAEQQLYEAQANYLNALYDTLVAKEDLYIALGQ